MKVLKWLVDRWLGGFMTASFFYLLKIYNRLPEESKSEFTDFQWLFEIVNYKIPLWTLFAVTICIVFLMWLKKKLKSYDVNDYEYLESPKNIHESYREDEFGVNKTVWTWGYEWNSSKQAFGIINLKPKCACCNNSLDFTGNTYRTANCPKCSLEEKQSYFNVRENIGDVETEIIRRAKAREFN